MGDVGSWKDEKYSDQRPALLNEVMELIPDGTYVLLELKGKDQLLGKQAVDSALEHRWDADKLKVIGFDLPLMTAVKQQLVEGGLPDVKVYLLKLAFISGQAFDAVGKAKDNGLDGVDLCANLAVNDRVLARAESYGLKVGVWVTE